MSEEIKQPEVPKKNLGGRPLTPIAKKLYARIKKLEQQLEETKAVNLSKIEEIADLTMSAYCVIFNEEKKCFDLIRVGFDKSNGLGKIVETTKLADSYIMALQELKKMVATNVFIQKEKK